MAIGIAVDKISGAAELICRSCGAIQLSSFAPLLLQLRQVDAEAGSCHYCGATHAEGHYALGIQMDATPLAVPAGQPQPVQAPAPSTSGGDEEEPPKITIKPGPIYLEIKLPRQISPFTTLYLADHPSLIGNRYDSFDLLTREIGRILAPTVPFGKSQLIWSGSGPLAITSLATYIAETSNSMPSVAVRLAPYKFLQATGVTAPQLTTR